MESPKESYANNRVCVTGTITEFRGTPEIVANDPSQITTECPRQDISVGGLAGLEPEADLEDDLELGNLAGCSVGQPCLRWYCGGVTDDFEFWTLKAGPDGLTRISVRASGRDRHELFGRGRRESWLIDSQEAERDILKRWAAFHLERVGFLPAWATRPSLRPELPEPSTRLLLAWAVGAIAGSVIALVANL